MAVLCFIASYLLAFVPALFVAQTVGYLACVAKLLYLCFGRPKATVAVVVNVGMTIICGGVAGATLVGLYALASRFGHDPTIPVVLMFLFPGCCLYSLMPAMLREAERESRNAPSELRAEMADFGRQNPLPRGFGFLFSEIILRKKRSTGQLSSRGHSHRPPPQPCAKTDSTPSGSLVHRNRPPPQPEPAVDRPCYARNILSVSLGRIRFDSIRHREMSGWIMLYDAPELNNLSPPRIGLYSGSTPLDEGASSLVDFWVKDRPMQREFVDGRAVWRPRSEDYFETVCEDAGCDWFFPMAKRMADGEPVPLEEIRRAYAACNHGDAMIQGTIWEICKHFPDRK